LSRIVGHRRAADFNGGDDTHQAALDQGHVTRLDGDIRPGADAKADIGLRQKAHELNANRIQRFKLDGFVDFFISSCFVHLRKPNADIRIALESPNASPSGSLYRKHPDVRPDRGRFGDTKHSPYRLQVHVRQTGFVRIAE
jgi:hypothetical protein